MVLYLSPTYEGKRHDKTICDLEEIKFDVPVVLWEDLGFIGLNPDNADIRRPVMGVKESMEHMAKKGGEAWDEIKNAALEGWEWISKTAWPGIREVFKSGLDWLTGPGGEEFKNEVKVIWNEITDFVGKIWDDSLGPWFNEKWDKIQIWWKETAWPWITEKIGNGFKALGGIIVDAIKSAIGGDLLKMGIKKVAPKLPGAQSLKVAASKAIPGVVGKGLAKAAVKKIPVVGAIAGAGFAAKRAIDGDWAGAAMELGSGLASIIPVVGTAVSAAADVAIMARDIKKSVKEEKHQDFFYSNNTVHKFDPKYKNYSTPQR